MRLHAEPRRARGITTAKMIVAIATAATIDIANTTMPTTIITIAQRSLRILLEEYYQLGPPTKIGKTPISDPSWRSI